MRDIFSLKNHVKQNVLDEKVSVLILLNKLY